MYEAHSHKKNIRLEVIVEDKKTVNRVTTKLDVEVLGNYVRKIFGQKLFG